MEVVQRELLAYIISDHGFGHAARSCSVINALLNRGAVVHVVSKVPRAFFEESIIKDTKGSWHLHEVKTDVGAFQATSVDIDWTKTVEALELHWNEMDAKAASVAETLRSVGVQKVVFDICALGPLVAALLHVPAVAISNFTFDWIYEAEKARVPGLIKYIDLMKRSYAHTSLWLALPFTADDMHSFDGIPRKDIGLVSRRPTRSRAQVLSLLELSELDSSRLLLYSFGGHHFPIEECFAKWSVPQDWRVVWVEPTDKALPSYERVVVIPHSRLRALGLPYIDLLAAMDAVLCKTGYGVVAELITTRRVALYTDRPGWIEHDWLIKGLHAHVPAMRVTFDEALHLLPSLWPRIAELLVDQRRPTLSMDGAEQAAEIICNLSSTPTSATTAAPPASKAKKKKKQKKKNKPAAAQDASAVVQPTAAVAVKETAPAAATVPETTTETSDEAAAKAAYERELAWCIHQLQLGLRRARDPAQVKESQSVIDKLSSAKISMAQKRHLMRVVFGDYRKHMQREQQQQKP